MRDDQDPRRDETPGESTPSESGTSMEAGNASEGGLFDWDETPVKRENPYLKKNRQAAKAEKQAAKAPRADKTRREKKAKPSRRAAPETPHDPNMTAASFEVMPPEETAPAPADKPYVRRRTVSDFFFEHVKLITAILTIIVVLSLVLITDVVGIVEGIVEEQRQSQYDPLTMPYVEGLWDRAEPITWSDLARFRRHISRAQDSVTWTLEVKGTPYQVMISGVSTEKPPVYVYLYDMDTGDRVDLNKEDLQEFLATHPA